MESQPQNFGTILKTFTKARLDALCPREQCLCHVGTLSCLPGLIKQKLLHLRSNTLPLSHLTLNLTYINTV